MMKKLFTLALACGALSLAACETQNQNEDYGYETQAPYGESRTVGKKDEQPVRKADRVFNETQRK